MNKSITVSIIHCLVILSLLLQFNTVKAQPLPKSPEKVINQVDAKNKRQGFWHVEVPARLGEFGFTEFGTYVDNKKNGVWYKLDEYGRLKSIEQFRMGVLNGISEYYEKGNLVLRASFRGLNQDRQYDTVLVIDPETEIEDYVVVRTDRGSVKHGAFRYYDPIYGHLVKIEEYQVDSLIYTRIFHRNAVPDSVVRKNIEQEFPHNKDPQGKKGRVNSPRSSLIK